MLDGVCGSPLPARQSHRDKPKTTPTHEDTEILGSGSCFRFRIKEWSASPGLELMISTSDISLHAPAAWEKMLA